MYYLKKILYFLKISYSIGNISMKVAFLDSDNKDFFLNNCSDFLDEYKLLKPFMKDLGAELDLVNWKNIKNCYKFNNVLDIFIYAYVYDIK